jgi:hypothetical protein
MFGDNQSVVTSSTLPHSTLSKRWNALSYHASEKGLLLDTFATNTSPVWSQSVVNILMKALAHAKARIFLDPLLFWKGDLTACHWQSRGPLETASPCFGFYSPLAWRFSGQGLLWR